MGHTYMRLQHVIESARVGGSVTCFTAALARSSSMLPTPPGTSMIRIGGRTLEVKPGTDYIVNRSSNIERAQSLFASLIAAARTQFPDTLYTELCQGATDDAGNERSMGYVGEHGTTM